REEPDSFTPSDATSGGVAAVNAQTATVATRRRPGERYDWPGSMRPKVARRDEAFGMRTKSGDEAPHSKKRTIAGGKFSGMVRIPTSDAQMHSSISTTLPVSERDGKTASGPSGCNSSTVWRPDATARTLAPKYLAHEI